ncbi:MAG: glycosyltransferase family protein [Sedimentisphaerales bacterium]|nr:glycosyltransferase family protein [Sedimentisphaerales bacterium]
MEKQNPKIVITIEARMTSSRLPGKVMLPVNGKPVLEHLVNRLKQVKSSQEIVLATTVNKTDDCLVELARRQGIAWFRGSEEDVLNRVIGAAESVDADIVVEVTGDCPVIDPLLIEQSIQMFLHNPCDFLSNGPIPGDPVGCGYPIGMVSPVFRMEALKRSATETADPLDHEHVMLYIYNHPEKFGHLYLIAPGDLYWPELALTLDEPKDYELLKKIIEHFGDANPYFSCREVIELLQSRPEWVAINRDVRRTAVLK